MSGKTWRNADAWKVGKLMRAVDPSFQSGGGWIWVDKERGVFKVGGLTFTYYRSTLCLMVQTFQIILSCWIELTSNNGSRFAYFFQ